MTWKFLNQKQLLPQRWPAPLQEHKSNRPESTQAVPHLNMYIAGEAPVQGGIEVCSLALPSWVENRVYSCLNFVDSRNNIESTVW